MESVLRRVINDSLGQYIYPNAIFMAERLLGNCPSLENLCILAHCYSVSGDSGTAYRLLYQHAPFNSPDLPPYTARAQGAPPLPEVGGVRFTRTKGPRWQCMYLLAVCSAHLSKWQECERILLELGCDSDAGVSYWLGVCGRRLGRRTNGEHFVRSQALNPFMFTAFESGMQLYNCYTTNPFIADIQHHEQHQQQQHQPSSPSESSSPAPTKSFGGPPVRPLPNKSAVATAKRATPPPSADEDGKLQLLHLLRYLAEAVRLLYSYQCRECLQLLNSPAFPEKASGYVVTLAALAAFHSGMHEDCTTLFSSLHAKEPWRLNTSAMVYYSTALWQMRQVSALTHLAQRMIDTMPHSAYTLCVVGNAHSRTNDSKTAVVMFNRATQMEPFFAYAYTLRGHELLATDQKQEAEQSFRDALRQDERHYAAKAGLGEFYYRLEDDIRARQNLKAAAEINPQPSILIRLAATYHRRASTDDLPTALSIYDRILKAHPRHFAAQTQQVVVLMRMNERKKAVDILQGLAMENPQEPKVQLLLGECYAHLSMVPNAVMAYQRAIDLDPNRAAPIRAMLDRLMSQQQTVPVTRTA